MKTKNTNNVNLLLPGYLQSYQKISSIQNTATSTAMIVNEQSAWLWLHFQSRQAQKNFLK